MLQMKASVVVAGVDECEMAWLGICGGLLVALSGKPSALSKASRRMVSGGDNVIVLPLTAWR